MIIYVDTAAALRLLIDEAGTDAMVDAFESWQERGEHLLSAARTPHGLRSADAIHLAVAFSLEAEALVAFDRELSSAAEREGMRVLQPGG